MGIIERALIRSRKRQFVNNRSVNGGEKKCSRWVIRDPRRKMLHDFLFDICGLQGGFTLEKHEQQCNVYIRRTFGRDKIVLMLVSGGLDFVVRAVLLHKALLQGDA
ncbi:hypothetical protein OUZ56_021448 [Daphnia magna]|uniref:Uncharacterized protein n=1 Tax=Daphnia magna TaxID=35525 RepID=A0ABQ9ZHE2_9CRUS|nr:hypothetical protein OUZ56_021448 [Daphnia magna]